MGNFNTCMKLQNSPNLSNMAKLVDPQGQLRLVKLPITVAEIMMENSNFALTPVDELRRTHRVVAMKADDVLIGRKVYLLVPVEKVNSRLTQLQMGAIESTLLGYSCNGKASIRTPAGCKVSPVMEVTGLGGDSLEDLVKNLGGRSTSVAGQRKRFCKTWEPVLEPIIEGC